jgi:hypothetical protein
LLLGAAALVGGAASADDDVVIVTDGSSDASTPKSRYEVPVGDPFPTEPDAAGVDRSANSSPVLSDEAGIDGEVTR